MLTTMDLPITEYCPSSSTRESRIFTRAIPSAHTSMFPRSPTCLEYMKTFFPTDLLSYVPRYAIDMFDCQTRGADPGFSVERDANSLAEEGRRHFVKLSKKPVKLRKFWSVGRRPFDPLLNNVDWIMWLLFLKKVLL